MRLLEKIIRKVLYWYAQREESNMRRGLGSCGNGANIQYPFTISHSELIKLGAGSVILKDCRMQVYPELTGVNATISIGGGSFICYRFCVLAGADVNIGRNCSIASDVTIVSENHGMDPSVEQPYGMQPLTIAPVSIGDGCWIGDKVIILPGVTIGKRCVIGAGSVVTKDIDDFCIAVGNPAKVIKRYDLNEGKWIAL